MVGVGQEKQEAVVSCEAVKYAARQNRDGVVISLLIHPNDVPRELFSAPIGSRYFVALVEIGDDEQPVMPEARAAGKRIAMSAGMLCRSPQFQEWVSARTGQSFNPSDAKGMEHMAAEYIRTRCGISSRAQLAENRQAQAIFKSIREAFERGQWL